MKYKAEWPEVAIFRQKMLQILATFPPIFKSFVLFFAKLLKCGLLFWQNPEFGIFWNFLGYFWEYNLAALLLGYLEIDRKVLQQIWVTPIWNVCDHMHTACTQHAHGADVTITKMQRSSDVYKNCLPSTHAHLSLYVHKCIAFAYYWDLCSMYTRVCEKLQSLP